MADPRDPRGLRDDAPLLDAWLPERDPATGLPVSPKTDLIP